MRDVSPPHEAGEGRPDRPGRAVLFGPFRLLADQKLLLEGDKQVPLGARALELLVALTSQAGDVLSNADLMTRVWRGLFVEESNVRVHVAGLRRALRDGQDGNRYIVNIPGRGYSFVAPVEIVWGEDSRPAQTTVSEHPATLPRPIARVVGRDAIVDALCSQLAQRRFFTLVGPGGIGKTTVAVAVAHRVLGSYPDGVCFVDFSSIRDPDLVPSTIAGALGLAVPSQDAMPAVVAHLGRRSVLLVLDNCEHVIEMAANAAELISSSAADVHILATSREPLRAAGERVHRLPPLEGPPASAGLTADEALTFPCVQLFMERVSANLDGFRLSDADAPVVAEICRTLDGIALAIELAAGRVAAFGVRELAGRLDDRFRLLTSGRRTALPRHQTLAATLDWSYELLPDGERSLLRRLSIFAGEFSLEAAVAVMAGPDTAQVIAHIADLVSKSLVAADWSTTAVRYRLLDTTRLYGAEKLRSEHEFADVARAHADYMGALFQTAEAEAEILPTQQWRVKYANQIDNLRAALEWAGSPEGDPKLYVSLAIAAVPLWVHLSLMGECRMWVERGLAMVVGEDRAAMGARMRLLAALGWSLMYAAGRASEIGATWAATLELADALDDANYRLRAIWGVWIGKLNRGDLNAALALAARLLDLVRDSSDQTDLMMADRLMATTLHYRGDQHKARMYLERMFSRYSAATVRPRIARFHVDQQVTAGYFQARILWLQGDVDQALAAVQRNIGQGEALGHALSFASVLGQAACPIALFTGDLAAARQYAARLLEHAGQHALHLWSDWARCFERLVAIKQGDVAAGLEGMQAVFDKVGDSRFLPRYMLLLAEYAAAIGRSGQCRLGLQMVDDILTRCARTEERWYEPELMRMRGELLVLDGGAHSAADIEGPFIQAIALAERQGARSWQLRAAISLARVRRDAGHDADPKRPLADIYGMFKEGFTTWDLRQASELLSDP